ncbi:MBL fold metallo-hydrolase [Methanotorris formicicus]|uniref:RNA-metabolising metallo-beta-lactamase n=1 Tax=Methanotorris formicicus Mc-S-70 TaxID=647171 RepID=H1L124_9EURY|nr:MBL fold metallo-hydrolase [Methanotorris formicicus]EHP84189.1 RNA-metabolising metallo-beta-lactamase [Methanotorris formicicus Mc-S-70]
MKITFRGAAMEVGRSCIEIDSGESKILLDCGVKLTGNGIEYPILDDIKVDGVFVSHAHLDHVGALPVLTHKQINVPIHSTPLTKEITKILLKDSLKIGMIEHISQKFNMHDIKKCINLHVPTYYNKRRVFMDFVYEYFDAGHIPGSASILLDYGDKKILYTGDVKVRDTRLVKGADLSYTNEDIDVLIIESTYGNSIHPDREETEKKFLQKVKETINRGGVALIPVFAVNRAQEILLILAEEKFDIPIFFDGMAVEITEIMLRHSEYLRDAERLEKAYSMVYVVESRDERDKVIEYLKENGGIVVTTAGMLDGGPILHYISEMWDDPKNSLILTGYQVEDTNGRYLIETGYLILDGQEIKPKLEVTLFDFSAHAGMDELHEIVNKVNPETLIIQHGDELEVLTFKKWAIEKGFNVHTPKLGESMEI